MKKLKLTNLLSCISLIALSLVLTKCKKDPSNLNPAAVNSLSDVKVVNGRLSFSNPESFKKAIELLNKKGDSEIDTWVRNFNFSSLYKSVDSVNADSLSLKRFPLSYQAVLNTAGEVTIGDTIIWYAANGLRYSVPNLSVCVRLTHIDLDLSQV